MRPTKFLDHVPQVSRPDLPVSALKQSVERCVNDLFVASREIIQMDMKNSAVSQLVTGTDPKSEVAILF